jgi:cadmium resistance protein CadD (predicted permease)
MAVSVDELFTLILFYSSALHDTPGNTIEHHSTKQIIVSISDIIIGQILGFTIIIAVSLSGYFFGVIIPMNILYLIGFVPLIVGCQQLKKVIQFWMKKYNKKSKSTNLKMTEIKSISSGNTTTNYSSISPEELDFAIDDNKSDSSSEDEDETLAESSIVIFLRDKINICFSIGSIIVCATVLAEGTEEIAVFMPLFVLADTRIHILIVLTSMYFLLFALNVLAIILVSHKDIGSCIARYSKNITPFVLIGLGLFVLSKSILIDIL